MHTNVNNRQQEGGGGAARNEYTTPPYGTHAGTTKLLYAKINVRRHTHRVQHGEHGLVDGEVLGEVPLGHTVEEGRRHVPVEAAPPIAHHEVRGVPVVVCDGHVERIVARDLPFTFECAAPAP